VGFGGGLQSIVEIDIGGDYWLLSLSVAFLFHGFSLVCSCCTVVTWKESKSILFTFCFV
jgi:hypothetical protein